MNIKNPFFSIALLLIALSNNVLAQPIMQTNNQKQEALNNARKIIAYNGAVVGYAKACFFPKHEYQLIEDGLFNFIRTNNQYFNELDLLNLKNYYEEIKDKSFQKKSVTTKIECDLFNEEFKKIYSATKEAIMKRANSRN